MRIEGEAALQSAVLADGRGGERNRAQIHRAPARTPDKQFSSSRLYSPLAPSTHSLSLPISFCSTQNIIS